MNGCGLDDAGFCAVIFVVDGDWGFFNQGFSKAKDWVYSLT